ncbi:MAG: DEAD/DEAH box helicase [Treponema sp.]|nr:DEAD/DEAH box helicase [Treponema sp.]
MIPLPFHPLINLWFSETLGEPTAVQGEAWPLIEKGEHVLAVAPTGSGKTLAAFLPALSRLARGIYPAGELSVLYVSPLKALNEDIRRNLAGPLEGIRARFAAAGEALPGIRAETRSGDTAQAERRRFYREPPSILALTPESLAIILLNPRGRKILSSVRYLITDEIHSVLGTKRGSFLSCQIDRLALEAGEFQRVILSATLRPAEAAAEFAGGLMPEDPGSGKKGGYLKRPVRIVAPPSEKKISLSVEYPAGEEPAGSPPEEGEEGKNYRRHYHTMAGRILERVRANRTTLVFTSSRRRAETLCQALNEEAGETAAFAHHGSLAKELRLAVERRLAEGSLPCVVATSSLELGIDIGSADEVILAGGVHSAAAALQRIGRSGHGVGKESRGLLLPFHGMDLLLAAAIAGSVRERDIEETRPIENPLDILAQLILALCADREWKLEELYNTLRGFYIFRKLPRPVYEKVLGMLAGWGKQGRLRELKVRLFWDRESGVLSAAPGTLTLLYSSGGAITSRGLYSLRLADGKTKIGELDEEFVWERRLGDVFDFGNRSWRISAIGSEAVEAVPLDKPSGYIPFWRAEAAFRSPPLTRRILEILDKRLPKRAGNESKPEGEGASPLLPEDLPEFTGEALEALNLFLGSQERAQGGCPLSGRGRIAVEILDQGERGGEFYQVLFHSFRGGGLNYPLSLALAQETEDRLGNRVDCFCDDNSILLLFPRTLSSAEGLIREALQALNRFEDGVLRGERQFRRRFESGSRFGAAFREAAERSLCLPRSGFGKRLPLWIQRQRSRRLFDAVSVEDDFPLSAEAWRTCLADEFDMEAFRDLIGSLADGSVETPFFRTGNPSPFARGLVWQETNSLLYEYDERKDLRPGPGGKASLSDRAIAEALGDPSLRPEIPAGLAKDFAARLRREIPGWAPEDEASLAEWVKERIAIPLDEWESLIAALPPSLGESLRAGTGIGPGDGIGAGKRLRILRREGAAIPSVLHAEWTGPWLSAAWTLLGPWMRYQGPLPLSRIEEVFGPEGGLGEEEDAGREEAGGGAAGEGELVRDVWILPAKGGAPAKGGVPTEGGAPEGPLLCDRENLDLLLRLVRRKARPQIRERPAALLAPFLALRQGLAGRGGSLWDWAAGLPLPARLWETELFSARQRDYSPETLDREIREGRLVWYGAGKERAGLCGPGDLDLVLPGEVDAGGAGRGALAPLFSRSGKGAEAFFDSPRDFWEIKNASGLETGPCVQALWEAAWQGRLSADTWEPLRQGTENGFSLPAAPGQEGPDLPSGRGFANPFSSRAYPRLPRALRDKWRAGPPVPGRWYSLDPDEGFPPGAGREEDPLYREELDRGRVRLLLRRWGLLCRPLLEREDPAFSWSRLLPAMRRMELAGELEEAERCRALFWMNAADPASPAGLEPEDPPGYRETGIRLPARSRSNRIYYRGPDPAALSLKNGKELSIFIPPEDPQAGELAELIKVPHTRKVHAEKKLVIETINGKGAGQSAWAGLFVAAGFVKDRGKLFLW